MTKENPIIHIRLVNGEEVIGALANKTDSSLFISHPLVVDQVAGDDGKYRIVLNNYLPFADEKICEFINPHIISVTNLHPEVERYYSLSLKMAERYDSLMLNEIKNNNDAIDDYISSGSSGYKQIQEDDLDEDWLGHDLSSNTIH